MATSASQVFAALRKKVGFEVVSQKEGPAQLRILGRILDDGQGRNSGNWKVIKYRLFTAMEDRPWKADISKWYFIKKETKKLVYAWRVLLQGDDIAQHYADISNIIMTSPSARSDVMEIPLVGNSLNDTAGGKRGAGPAGSVPIGPLAAHRKAMGG